MKRMKMFVTIMLAVYMVSCEGDSSILSVDNDNIIDIEIEDTNSPRVIKENGSFSFGLRGKDYSGTTSEPVHFDTEQIVLAINLENHQSGRCVMTIKSNYNQVLFTKEITNNIIYSEALDLDDYPEQITFNFFDFTGTIKAAVAEED
ncbi:MAG: hypothetical protein JXQ65_01155 [Candidatus Marinimicrobia bacterium]|nr:hypothetical protein [Candidatus Neomarinimicrobiota bacterium]